MRFYRQENVYEMAKKRIEYIFNEFEEVIVWVSGGKDSTVVFNLALETARKLNRLPLKVGFIDSEGEWEHTIDQIRRIMYNPDVKPYWLQIPFLMNNVVNFNTPYIKVWDENNKSPIKREFDPISIKENKYGIVYFEEVFQKVCEYEFKGKKTANISGVRAEESPGRFVGLTASRCYKGITWGKKHRYKLHTTFYPIYDWSYTDVWKAIHENNWEYNKIYDYQYRYGLKVQDMRVSCVHHETSIRSLFYMQEIEPENYERLVNRIKGVDGAAKFGFTDFYVQKLPFMFKDWLEYRDFLIDKLIGEEFKAKFRNRVHNQDLEFKHLPNYISIVKGQINAILCNDTQFVKLHNIDKRYSDKDTRLVKKKKLGKI